MPPSHTTTAGCVLPFPASNKRCNTFVSTFPERGVCVRTCSPLPRAPRSPAVVRLVQPFFARRSRLSSLLGVVNGDDYLYIDGERVRSSGKGGGGEDGGGRGQETRVRTRRMTGPDDRSDLRASSSTTSTASDSCRGSAMIIVSTYYIGRAIIQ